MTLRPGARAVVTGAASGIGRATAAQLLAAGVGVLAVDRSESGLATLAEAGGEPLVADLADPSERTRVVETARGCDYLVNAAGIIRLSPLFEVTLEEWREVVTVNLESVFFLLQGIGPTMPAGGAIVNLSSSSAKTGTTLEAAPYASTKAAILSLTRAYAFALRERPVRVNAIVPGIVDTPMQDAVLEEIARVRKTTVEALDQARIEGVWLGREASADECAGVICFLLSDEAGYITGQGINFTGGLVTW